MKCGSKWFFAAGLTLLSRAFAEQVPTVRNIVFILADDLGIKDLGCYGSEYYETPNLDRFATEGVRFENAYSAHPVCSPTRASILTGRYPARLHLTAYIPGQECPKAKLSHPQDWIKYMRDNEVTYAEAFRAAGFATCHIGKWHVGSREPSEHGFETVTVARDAWSNPDLEDPWFVRYYTDAAERFMEERRNEPFLLTLSHGTVHVPLHEKEDLIAKYRKKTPGSNGQNNPVYAAMVERMDWSVGRVLLKLKELGLEQNTAVVFFSDNGGLSQVYDKELKKSITATSNRPYRGGKSILYEGGIRVPLLIRWPGVTLAGTVCRTPVISNDLYPTFLQMAGLSLKPEQHLDGQGLLPLLQGDTLDRNCLYWHYPHYQSMPPHGAVRCGDWKLIEHYEDGKLELFNLAGDISESRNLISTHPEVAARMKKMLHNHLLSIGAQMPTENPGYDASVHWRTDSHNGEYDSLEFRQAEDMRRIVTDPNRDSGASWKLPNVLLIGDSISIQYTSDVRKQLRGIANVVRPFDPKRKKPVNCGSTEVGLKGLDQWLGTNRWDIIHFNWGLHDLCYRNPKATHLYGNRDKVNGAQSVPLVHYIANLEKLVVRLKQTGAKLIWAPITVVPENEPGRFVGDEQKYNRAAAEIMRKHGVETDDLYSLSASFPADYFMAPGDVHYADAGIRKLASQVAGSIQRSVEKVQ
ncbi:sulfatase-like hydrolase/transferase [Tichowtungia aerotolerans]|uniref:Sulfatase-like hydrolase/transferase n=1 Tax=Tichowtungia aerotolerans TaxID=2697043 RepID=A0A6P1MC83_9BACT|nr:sulfatase-like hydrolase/transferase [Tichowtungia aerotolerans]QHI68695.1 sulfatase-like hydrolase/transferase [Tichowtungia aerotolerans]